MTLPIKNQKRQMRMRRGMVVDGWLNGWSMYTLSIHYSTKKGKVVPSGLGRMIVPMSFLEKIGVGPGELYAIKLFDKHLEVRRPHLVVKEDKLP